MANGRGLAARMLLSPRAMIERVVPEAATRFVGHRGGRAARVSPPPVLPAGETLGRIGSLEVRLAVSRQEIRFAQGLRYRIFFEEMSARPDMRARLTRRDADRYDAFCDHLLVVDHAGASRPQVVGTYRLLRQEVAAQRGGFYTAGEFEIAPLIARHAELNFLELGRSCVLAPWRTKRTMELLWHGIWAYVLRHRIDVMIGCASLKGTDPAELALPLSFLHHFNRAPDAWRAGAIEGHGTSMDLMPREAIDPRRALAVLPPLLKGYLRLGAVVGDVAVVDRRFGTTDVLIVLPVAAISERYVAHYGADAGRFAA